MGRPRHDPDTASRRQAEAMAGYGMPEADIAVAIGIDPKTLRKHYHAELLLGHVKANSAVAQSLFRKATGEGPQSVTAAIFWLKTRARWKEVSVHEHGGVPDQPIEQVNRIEFVITAPDRERLQKERQQHAESQLALPGKDGTCHR